MDTAGILIQAARDITTAKFLIVSAVALTLYDYLLTFNNEVRYVWRGRKSWIFYLYITNRILLLVNKFWDIYYTSSPRKSKTVCRAAYYYRVIMFLFYLFSSDVFIILRVYAITFRSKILVVYFGILVLARLAVSLASYFAWSLIAMDLPRIPVDAFNLCGYIIEPKSQLALQSLGMVFELSAFLVIVLGAYRNKGTLKFSALVRTIVTEATIYFFVMVAAQTYIQLSAVLMRGIEGQLSSLAYGLLNPVLTLRFVITLKQSADPDGGEEWQLKHFSSVQFKTLPSPDARVSTIREDIEMDPVDHLNHQSQTREP